MRARIFEARREDRAFTCMALEMADEVSGDRVRLLRRAGYVPEEKIVVMIILDTCECRQHPDQWPELWQSNVHKWVGDNFHQIYDGRVVDADFLLGERDAPRVSSTAS